MGLRLFRSTLLASAIASTWTYAGVARAQGSQTSSSQDSGSRLGSIERQIQALQAELRRMKSEMAVRNREQKAAQSGSSRSYTPPVTQVAPIMPQIPAGYALSTGRAWLGTRLGGASTRRAAAAQAPQGNIPGRRHQRHARRVRRGGKRLSITQHCQRHRHPVQQHPVPV